MSYGRVDIERFQVLKSKIPNLRAFLDGEDVTDRCVWADDQTGQAHLFVLDTNGKAFINPFTGLLASETKQGKVEFRDISEMLPDQPHDYSKDLTDFRKWLGW